MAFAPRIVVILKQRVHVFSILGDRDYCNLKAYPMKYNLNSWSEIKTLKSLELRSSAPERILRWCSALSRTSTSKMRSETTGIILMHGGDLLSRINRRSRNTYQNMVKKDGTLPTDLHRMLIVDCTIQ